MFFDCGHSLWEASSQESVKMRYNMHDRWAGAKAENWLWAGNVCNSTPLLDNEH